MLENDRFALGGHTIVESIENRDYVVNKMSDELGEIIRILQLVTIDDVLLSEFDDDEQHNLKKLLVKRSFSTEFFRKSHRNRISIRKHSVIVCFKQKFGYPTTKPSKVR